MLTPLVIKYIIRWVAEKDAARRAGLSFLLPLSRSFLVVSLILLSP
jgi:hypothetical protein